MPDRFVWQNSYASWLCWCLSNLLILSMPNLRIVGQCIWNSLAVQATAIIMCGIIEVCLITYVLCRTIMFRKDAWDIIYLPADVVSPGARYHTEKLPSHPAEIPYLVITSRLQYTEKHYRLNYWMMVISSVMFLYLNMMAFLIKFNLLSYSAC